MIVRKTPYIGVGLDYDFGTLVKGYFGALASALRTRLNLRDKHDLENCQLDQTYTSCRGDHLNINFNKSGTA